MTGLYPDRQGITVSNSYFYQPPSKIPAFSSAFKYWTDLVDDATGANNPLPNMITDGQKTTPAPWVPYTRAGCDVGAVSLANIELENTGTGPFGDMSEAFGTGSAGGPRRSPGTQAPSGLPLGQAADGLRRHRHPRGRAAASAPATTNVANSRPAVFPTSPGLTSDTRLSSEPGT
jgi:hypothetical protein